MTRHTPDDSNDPQNAEDCTCDNNLCTCPHASTCMCVGCYSDRADHLYEQEKDRRMGI